MSFQQTIDDVISEECLDSKQNTIKLSNINVNYIGVYVSRITCPPCVKFTQQLNEFYKTVNYKNKQFEVIFCSQDFTQADFDEYFFEHQNKWLAVDYEKHDIRKDIRTTFDIKTVPTLLIFDGKTGELITKDGRNDIISLSKNMVINKWKNISDSQNQFQDFETDTESTHDDSEKDHDS